MASSDPPSSHGIFISGISAIIVEKGMFLYIIAIMTSELLEF